MVKRHKSHETKKHNRHEKHMRIKHRRHDKHMRIKHRPHKRHDKHSKHKKSKKKPPSKEDNLKETIDYIENYSHYYRKKIPIVGIIIFMFIIIGFSSNKLYIKKDSRAIWPGPLGGGADNNLIMLLPIVNMFYFVYKYYQHKTNLEWWKKIFYGIGEFFISPFYLFKNNKIFPAAYIFSFIGLVLITLFSKSQYSNILFDINNLLLLIDIVEATFILFILTVSLFNKNKNSD
jgi:hypothetical protein